MGAHTEGPDTIFARATPKGEGAIAILRVSGDQALAALSTLYRSPAGRKRTRWRSHRIVAGRIVDPLTLEPIDEVLVLYMEKWRSFTGEPVAEIHCHGGEGVARSIEALLSRHGLRPALPGEFTRRAFLNGRVTLDAAEAIHDLVRSRSEEGALVSAANLTGAVRSRIQEIRTALIDLLALLEANVDFPEDDVDDATRQRVDRELADLEMKVDRLASSYERGRMMREGVRVVLAGTPNVGKSSLMNALLRSERCIVTPVAGTTRDTIEETLTFRGRAFVLVDTAGLREAADEAERHGVTRTKAELDRADLILFVLDSTRDRSADEKEFAKSLAWSKKLSLLALNKIDCPGTETSREEAAGSGKAIAVSAAKGDGLETLMERIYELSAAGMPGDPSEPSVSNLRHRECLLRAGEALASFRAGAAAAVPLDVGLVDLNEASRHLASITGEIANEEILDAIFSRFCIGK